MAILAGIDLGTTYSSISWYDEYNERVDTIDLDTADGAKMVRSVVYYPGLGESPVVGDAAWNATKQFPDRVIARIKLSMGTDYHASVDNVEYTAPQVSAEILKVLAHDGTQFLGEDVKDVVIAVPAYFGSNERAATEEAGKLAGLNILGLLPEPHAVALAFAIDKVANITDRYLLVYDLGGGTFDVTLIHAKSEIGSTTANGLIIETLYKDGNARLGGLDWDHELAWMVAEKAMQQFNVDVLQDVKDWTVLFANCQIAKRQLSRADSVSIIADMANHSVDVSRSEFEDRTRWLLAQTEMLLERAKEECVRIIWEEEKRKSGWEILTDEVIPEPEKQRILNSVEVLVAGGSSRMPMVRKMIEARMGRPPLQHGNPELLVTIGAAYWAHLLRGGKFVEARGIRFADAAVLDAIGVEVRVPPGLSFDNVHFTMTGPGVLAPGTAHELQFWAHVEQQRSTVLAAASAVHGQPQSEMTVKSEGPHPLQRGSRISVRLKIDGLKCFDSHKWITWTGEIGNTAFIVEVPPGASEGPYPGRALIRLNGCEIAKMSFLVCVGSPKLTISEIPSRITSYRRAFASYANEDRVEVLSRVQGMEAAYKSLHVFVDIVDLRSGQNWERALVEQISKSDVFYLFWCRHAMNSAWVSKEWHWALAAKGQDFIDPIPLETPELAPPPEELAAKHFNDPLLAFIAAAGGVHSD